MDGYPNAKHGERMTGRTGFSVSLATLSLLLPLCLLVQTKPSRAAAAPAAQAVQTASQAASPAHSTPQRVQPETAFVLMAAEAEKGNAGAMLTLGRFYEQGVGIARNFTKALAWYEKAAKAGQAEGYYNMGVCYEIGMGVSADAAKALQNYQKAADMGMALAMYKLSSIFISGVGTAKDVAKGIAWLEKAVNAGLVAAANDLGAIYLAGLLGQKKDEKKALSLLAQAADLGSLDAVRNIAGMHKDGIGTKADPAAAYRWYCIARRGGYTGEDVSRMLGLLEGSLSTAQVQQAQKDADAWIENYGNRQSGK